MTACRWAICSRFQAESEKNLSGVPSFFFFFLLRPSAGIRKEAKKNKTFRELFRRRLGNIYGTLLAPWEKSNLKYFSSSFYPCLLLDPAMSSHFSLFYRFLCGRVGSLMNVELEGIWQELIVTLSKFYRSICLGWLKKSTKTQARILRSFPFLWY
jgi:hypothetical protein